MRRRKLKTEIAIATLECAWADLEYEIDRTRSLDSKLTGIASLSGLALSIGPDDDVVPLGLVEKDRGSVTA